MEHSSLQKRFAPLQEGLDVDSLREEDTEERHLPHEYTGRRSSANVRDGKSAQIREILRQAGSRAG